MKMTQLRHLAEVNPETPEFSELADEADVTFMPLETVWADSRRDLTRVVKKAEVSGGYVRFREGDILCPKVTPTFQAGRSTHIESLPHLAGAATTEVHVVRARPGKADPRYLKYRLLAKDFLEEGAANFQGVAGLQRVSADFIASLPVLCIPLEEQRRIADFLDDQVARIDDVVVARQKQTQLVEEDRLSSLRVAFHAGRKVPLRRLLREAVVGIVVQPAALYTDEANGIPALRGTDVGEGVISTKDLVRVTPQGHLMHPRSQLLEGDVVVVRTGDAGVSAVVPSWAEGWNCIDLVIARVNPALAIPEFVSTAINAARHGAAVAAAASGSIQQHFGVNALLDLQVPALDLVAQRGLADSDSLESRFASEARATIGTSVALMSEYKLSLITAAVTGELDVTTARVGVPA